MTDAQVREMGAEVDRTEFDELEAGMREHIAQCRSCGANEPCPYGENLLIAIWERQQSA